MSILIFAETWNGKLKKSSFEAITYAKKLSDNLELKTCTITFSKLDDNIKLIEEYGSDEIIKYDSIDLESIDKLAHIITNTAKKISAKHIVISNTSRGKSICSKIAIDTNSSLITNAIALPTEYKPINIKCKAFSSKAFSYYKSTADKNVITILPNSVGCETNENTAKITEGDLELLNFESSTEILREEKNSSEISLTDAERVVSAGRGLKAPENWKMRMIIDIFQILIYYL